MIRPRFPLATVAAGRVAELDAGAVLSVTGETWTARWWVAEGDTWRRPSTESTARTRLLDEMGVVETAVRVASGDVVSQTRAFVPAGSAVAAVGVDVTNDTPIPVAVAVVVGPIRHAELRGDALLVDGRIAVRFARRPSHWVGAADIDELAAVVTPDGRPDGEISFESSGWVAVVSPLPHRTALQFVVGAGDRESYPVPPTAEQVASGWAHHAERGARVEPADPNVAAALRRGRALLAGVRLDASTSLLTVAHVGRAAIRLGWDDQATLAAGLLADAQDRRGLVGDPDTTVAAIDVWAGRRRLGATIDEMEPSILPMASAVTALNPRRTLLQRSAPVVFADASGALLAASMVAASLGQTSLRDGLVRAAALATPTVASRAGSAPDRAIPGPWGLAHTADGSVDVAAVAGEVCDLIDGIVLDGIVLDGVVFDGDVADGDVADGEAGIALAMSWQPDQAGSAVECHGVPTTRGRVSYAIRWHGRRPALLWEIEPWETAPGETARPDGVLRAPTLDPSWSTCEVEGDALLAEPVGLGTSIVGTVIDDLSDLTRSAQLVVPGPAEGESFG